MSDFLDPNNEELLKDFFTEGQIHVDVLEKHILSLENNPNDKEAIDEIFRAAHTLKGNAATVEMKEIAQLTHAMEDVLDVIRSGKLQVNGEIVDALLQSVDAVKNMMDARIAGSVSKKDYGDLRKRLQGFLEAKPGAPVKKAPEPAQPSATKPDKKNSGLSEYEVLELKEAAQKGQTVYRIRVEFDEKNPMNTVGGIQVFAALKEKGTILKTEPEFEKLYEDAFFRNVVYYIASAEPSSVLRKLVSIPDVTLGSEIEAVEEAGAGVPATPASAAKAKEPERKATALSQASVAAQAPDEDEIDSEQTDLLEEVEKKKELKRMGVGSILRVESRRIDNLLNLVSEAVINKATFNQINSQFTGILSDLQEKSIFYKEKIKMLIDSIPEYAEQLQGGKNVKEIKKDLLERNADLPSLFDGFEGLVKATVGKFRGNAQNLGRITGELQEAVMRIRMVPISQIFSRFPRLVRDLSKSLEKKINLVIEGEDTELDKSVIEDLLDPLIHCVRNSIDHGIESPAERRKLGKNEEGKVLLKASNEGNLIIIEIGDDGKGIDLEAVRKKAIEKGIIHPNKALTDVEAFNLIFEAGFSTAKKVTSVSGRGVGLDVVRKQIEKLNGSVSVFSDPGVGTRMMIKLPLTLAIIQGLLVRVGEEIYAIPITSVNESHRIRPAEIRFIDNHEVFNVRNEVISLIRLDRLFKIPTKEESEFKFVVVVGSHDKKMGLIVDSLIGEEDVVIKPLRDKFTISPGIAGATILGDGTVSLIIDVSQLLDLGLKKEKEERRRREATIF